MWLWHYKFKKIVVLCINFKLKTKCFRTNGSSSGMFLIILLLREVFGVFGGLGGGGHAKIYTGLRGGHAIFFRDFQKTTGPPYP